MYIYHEILHPCKMLATSPLLTTIALGQCTLDRVDLGFPDGCNRLLRVQVRYHEIFIIPFNQDFTTGYNDIVLQIPMAFKVAQPPFELDIISYNLDDTYQHTLSVGLVVTYPADNPILPLDLSRPITILD